MSSSGEDDDEGVEQIEEEDMWAYECEMAQVHCVYSIILTERNTLKSASVSI